MADSRSQPVLQQVARPLNLIPVGLKEAALDSPTFRATAVHFSDQIEVVEKWLDGYVKSTGRLVHEVATLEELVNTHLARSTPPATISEAVLDHDYTLLAMKRYGEGAREFWSHTISGVRRMEATVVEPIRTFIQGELRNFKDSRRFLEQSQKSFDSLLSRYASQSKTKEASSLREDAFQLYEARKLYTKASMDFCVLAPQLRSTLDKLLVRICSDQWRDINRSREGLFGTFVRSNDEMERVRSWSAEMEAGEKVFRRELQGARKMLEEKAAGAARPSRELDEYSTSTVPYLGSKGPPTMNLPSPARPGPERAEKQGWLFLRTLTGKPARTVWTRRWFFVKNGIFGWLVQGTRTGGVEESERIGVLLCNVKPAFQEERRFAFEVKTKDNTILLQAETQHELIEWLESFENAKRKALEDTNGADSPTTGLHGKDAAFAINPPSAPEFAAKTSDGHGNHGSEDSSTVTLDRTATLPVPEREGTGLTNRSSFDVSSRKAVGGEREGEGARDHASRIMQKLDLHRKSNAGQSGPGASDQPSSLMTPSGGIASLISASHNILPVHSVPTVAPAPGSPAATTPVKAEMTIANVAAASALAQANRELPPSTLAPSTLANPPAPTNLSKTAVLVSGERGMGVGRSDVTGGMPSGMMANLWGSSNWGYINRLERGEVKQAQEVKGPNAPSPSRGATGSPPRTGPQQRLDSGSFNRENDPLTREISEPTGFSAPASASTSMRHRASVSVDVNAAKLQRPTVVPDVFPKNYPLQLKAQEAQFRMFFPNAPREDKLLLVFRAAWNPNDLQEFPGRVYVTPREVLFYSHHLGLVLTTGISLGSIQDVSAAPGKECDFLFIHLKEDRQEAGHTRITVKVFLEPLRLLQRRLNLLVRNSDSEEPLGLEALLNELTNIEKDKRPRTPSLESWEDVPITTPADGGATLGRSASVKTQKDLRTTLRISGGLFDDPNLPPDGREGMKFKLPAEPIVYEPRDFARTPVQRDFGISPKALFHLMFGDRSAVFQMLYHERRAEKIKQGPWTKLEGDRLGRAFEYQIEYLNAFGQARRANVADNQVIDVFNDHLCYVITDQKTPWHLPHHRDFTLVTQVVITFVAKSRCRLAIHLKVQWSKVPTFSKGIVEKQALDDLELDALDLADVVADQVRRLGPEARTKKAITIFGYVGQETQASEVSTGSAPSKNNLRRLPIRQRTLSSMLLETSRSVAGSVISSLMIWGFAFLRNIWKVTSAHKVILLLLMLSAATNVFFTSRDTTQWWTERNAGKFMARLGVGPNLMMSKAVHLADLDEIAMANRSVATASDSQCYATFRSLLSLSDIAAPSSSASGLASLSTSSARTAARRLHRTRQHLGAHRHELLVALRIVNAIERETLLVEWETWVRDELLRCEQVGRMLMADEGRPTEKLNTESGAGGKGRQRVLTAAKTGTGMNDGAGRELDAVREWYEGYCASCMLEKDAAFV